MKTTYMVFFLRGLPLEIERRGETWRITLEHREHHSELRATRSGDARIYRILDGARNYVASRIADGIEIEPNTIRFELFQLLAARGDVQVREEQSEKFDIRRYVSPQSIREGWGLPR
jgi:hypothetical protein